MGSTRLSGKVLREVCGRTLLSLQIERLKYSKEIDGIVVATTNKKIDDDIYKECEKNYVFCYRGSESDVLDRYYQTAKYNNMKDDDGIVRITGDCPLIDPFIVDEVIRLFKRSNADYASNVEPPTYPDGLDTEVFKFSALRKAWQNAKLKSEREHVTTYILNNEYFKRVNLKNKRDISCLRWTLDEYEDYKLIKFIYEKMYKKDSLFIMKDILNLMDQYPEIYNINRKYTRNEGLQKSLANDGEV